MILFFIMFKFQYSGVLKVVCMQCIFGIVLFMLFLIVGIVLFVIGDVLMLNLFLLLLFGYDVQGNFMVVIFGLWNGQGVMMVFGVMFMVGWVLYGFEMVVCYMCEFCDLWYDIVKVIFWLGVLCFVVMMFVLMVFQGVFGMQVMFDLVIGDGIGVVVVMVKIVGGGVWVVNVVVVMLMLLILLIVMMLMMGLLCMLYQVLVDGWLLKYLLYVNEYGLFMCVMWIDFGFNFVLLMMLDYMMVLLILNVCYMLFVFLNFQFGWIYWMDCGNWDWLFCCLIWLFVVGLICGYVNFVYVGVGVNLQGEGMLCNGLIVMLLIVLVFLFCYYWQDCGCFFVQMQCDMEFEVLQCVMWLSLMLYVVLIGVGLMIWLLYYFVWVK